MDYKQSGVNIDEGNRAVELIKTHVKTTYTHNVLNNLGNFAAAFRLDKSQYEDPILVSCTDGVGTKLMLAIELEIFDTIGIDLVAMSVNDLICMGANPLFFLDYYACHRLEPEKVQEVIKGMTHACTESGCALIGGEMAEMNDMYKKGDFDLAGFCVGVVDRPKIIDGTKISPKDNVYAFVSSGFHSNGYSLVRKVLTKDVCETHNIDRKQLLEPTKIYVEEVLKLIEKHTITGLCHITGGGIEENITRILKENIHVTIKKNSIEVPKIFHDVQKIGNISETEMYKVFNMGIGFVVISPDDIEETMEFKKIGSVSNGVRGVTIV